MRNSTMLFTKSYTQHTKTAFYKSGWFRIRLEDNVSMHCLKWCKKHQSERTVNCYYIYFYMSTMYDLYLETTEHPRQTHLSTVLVVTTTLQDPVSVTGVNLAPHNMFNEVMRGYGKLIEFNYQRVLFSTNILNTIGFIRMIVNISTPYIVEVTYNPFKHNKMHAIKKKQA